MADSLGRLIKNVGLFGIPGVVSRLASLITFPIITKALGVESFGVLDYYLTVANLTAVLIVFGLDSIAIRFFFEDEDPDRRRRLLSQVMTLQVVSCAAIPLGAFILMSNSGVGAGAMGDRPLLLALGLLQAALMAPIAQFQNFMMWTHRKAPYLISTVGQVALTVVGLLVVCVNRHPALVEILGLFVAMRLLFAVYGAWMCRDLFQATASLRGFKSLWAYGAPIGIIGVLGALTPFIERQAIASTMTAGDLGLYGAGSRIALLILLPISAFQMVWAPFAFTSFRQVAAQESYRLALKIFTIGGLAGCFVLAGLATPLLHILTSEEFIDGRVAVLPLCLGAVVKGVGDVAQLGIDLARKSWLKFIPFSVMTAIAVVVVPILAHRFGLAGAAWGTLLAFCAKAVIESRLAHSVHVIDWHGRRVILLVAAALAGGLIHGAALSTHGPGWAALLAFVLAGLVVVMGGFITLTRDERETLRNALRQLT